MINSFIFVRVPFLHDMKKITAIASLLVLFTACQKADIHPRSEGSEYTSEIKRLCPKEQTPAPTGSGDVNTLGGGSGSGSTSTVDPSNPTNPTDPSNGDITDPLRKKDRKDNK
ncbi:hypothetical protein D3C87_277690 [compost metagenome]